MIRLVGLKPNEPHRHCAIVALRVLNFGFAWNELRLLHNDPALRLQAGALERLSVTDACRQSLGRW